MRLPRASWLAAGLLLPTLGSAALTANMDIWDMDPSCKDETDFMQTIFNEALELASSAVDSLNFALLKQPDRNKDWDAFVKWNRIYRAMDVTLGFRPNRKAEEKQSDPNWSDAFSIFTKVRDGLQASQNSPPNGNVPELANRPGAKPKIVCGEDEDSAFKWLGLDDEAPEHAPLKLNQLPKFSNLIFEGGVGAWYNAGRYIWKKDDKGTPILCLDPRLRAAVYFQWDWIHFCPRQFTDEIKNRPTPTQLKNGEAKPGNIDVDTGHPSVNVFHELTHWFGGLNTPGVWKSGAVILDQTAVDYTGKLQKTSTGSRRKTYGKKYIWSLAMDVDKDNKANAANFGPKKALFNADSLAYFAFMSYVDNVDYAKGKGDAVPNPTKPN